MLSHVIYAVKDTDLTTPGLRIMSIQESLIQSYCLHTEAATVAKAIASPSNPLPIIPEAGLNIATCPRLLPRPQIRAHDRSWNLSGLH